MKIGYQLYSAWEQTRTPEGMRDTLKALSDMGYDGVELFIYGDVPAKDLKRMLREYHLEPIGTHVHKERWDADTEGEIRYAQEAEIPYLVYPWVHPDNRTPDFFRGLPETLEKLADLCAGRGITLQYHNHDFEYEMQDGERIMDYLLRANSSYLFELDTFWAGYAGVDPVKYMQELGERVQMIHIKDYLGIKDGEHRFAAIGTGTMDNAPIIRSARDMNKQWVIVELDNSPLTPMESARISIDNVRRILADDK